jgi:ABC-type xylose transport system permease subunit
MPAVWRFVRVKLWPWEYLFEPFSNGAFPDLYNQIFAASVIMLIATIIFYNVRTRQLHRHSIYLQMYEWLLWTGVIVFSLVIIYWIFRFDMIIVLSTLVIGMAMLAWIRFVRFPPYFRAYERQLAKQRYFSRERFSHPESTIRTKSSRRRRRRR